MIANGALKSFNFCVQSKFAIASRNYALINVFEVMPQRD